jgi:ubiquitin C-terminal hydrolase
MSPILNAFGGGIEKIYQCDKCENTKTTVEEFVSLNFKPLTSIEVEFIRSKFHQKGFKEGLVYKKESKKKTNLLSKLIQKKQGDIPVLTIRDYLCHLNYTRNSEQ